MLNKIKQQIKRNNEIVALAILVLIAIISTSYFSFNKNKIHTNYKNILNNVYLKKTVYYFLIFRQYKKTCNSFQSLY